jgi:protein-S-isoprenylcysteine O-methyltransferase Ste14
VTSAADVVLVAAWLVVLGHNAYLWARGVHRPTGWRRAVAGAVLAVAIAAAGAFLECASGGRVAAPAFVTAAGVVVACAGAALHVHARRTLGAAWSPRVDGAAILVEHGVYGVVRHPLYLGLVLLAIGTVAAHPSRATLAGAVGLLAGIAAKIAREDRALAATFGERWRSYRRDVPRLVPRLARRARDHVGRASRD